ncbi:MFS transporter [Streptomyces spiramenti]|uniref:MFS transporter n=1 Tax=Streptomyces spiramenti TaxID=2720606 RepID=UPI001FD82A14|nr:MFS transporter [Streptomyces spiramenti]
MRLAFAVLLTVLGAATGLMGGVLGRVELPLVLAVAVVGGCCGPVVSGGLSSLVARLSAPGADRGRAYARDAAVYNLASLAGPALAGATAVALSPAVALLGLASAALVAAALTASLPLADGTGAYSPGTGFWRDLAAGVRTVWRVRELRAVTAAGCLAFVGIGALTTTTVLLAESRGQAGAGGIFLTAFAAGGVAGAFALGRVRPAIRSSSVVVAGLLATGTGLAAAALVTSSPAAAGSFLLAGAGDGLLLAATLRLRADHSPERRRPQVFTIGAGLKISAAALGAGIAATAEVADARLYLLGAALLLLCAALSYVALRRG